MARGKLDEKKKGGGKKNQKRKKKGKKGHGTKNVQKQTAKYVIKNLQKHKNDMKRRQKNGGRKLRRMKIDIIAEYVPHGNVKLMDNRTIIERVRPITGKKIASN